MVRDAVPLTECGRALVVKLRHHGDVLLAAPVLTTLKSHAPKLEVDALIYDDAAPRAILGEKLHPPLSPGGRRPPAPGRAQPGRATPRGHSAFARRPQGG